MSNSNIEKYTKDIFVDTNEMYITALGNNYLANYITSGQLKRGFAVLSNKRIYFKGKAYTKEGSRYTLSKEEKTVDLRDITGTGFTKIRNVSDLLISAISFGIVFILFMQRAKLLGIMEEDRFILLQIIIGLLFVASPITALAYLLFYFFYNISLFEIMFAGGKIAFDTKFYKEKYIKNFQSEIRRAKDNAVDKNFEKENIGIKNHDSIADELLKLSTLFSNEAISQDEYNQIKSSLLKSQDKGN